MSKITLFMAPFSHAMADAAIDDPRTQYPSIPVEDRVAAHILGRELKHPEEISAVSVGSVEVLENGDTVVLLPDWETNWSPENLKQLSLVFAEAAHHGVKIISFEEWRQAQTKKVKP